MEQTFIRINGEAFRQLRIQFGFKQFEIAKAISVTNAAISSYENGRIKALSEDKFRKIAEVFNLPFQELQSRVADLTQTEDDIKKYTVYMHTSPSGKIYIGITGQDPQQRWQGGNGYNGNVPFTRAIRKYGWDSFTHEILFSGLTKKEAQEKEIELIAVHKSSHRDYGYNISPGGEMQTEESKYKCKRTRDITGVTLRESKRMLNIWADPEKRQSIIRKMQNKKRSEEQKMHMRMTNARRGKPLSDSTKEKLRVINQQRTGANSSRAKRVVQIDPASGKILNTYDTARLAAKSVGAKSISEISNICRGSGNTRHYKYGTYWYYEADYLSGHTHCVLNPEVGTNGRLVRTEASFAEYGIVKDNIFRRTISEQTKEAISRAHRKAVLCIETGIVYSSIRQAAANVGIHSQELISRQIQGKIKSAGGYTWQYV